MRLRERTIRTKRSSITVRAVELYGKRSLSFWMMKYPTFLQDHLTESEVRRLRDALMDWLEDGVK